MTLSIPWFQASRLQNFEGINFRVFQATKFVVFCYGSPRKLVEKGKCILTSSKQREGKVGPYISRKLKKKITLKAY